ncbi:MAG TPA: OsmC family protein [Acidobacteriota bacterium]
MAEYKTVVSWNRNGAAFTDNRYSRAHVWHFDGGIDVPASASPHVVRKPMSIEKAVDPEEAFVVSLSSCHLLWFLSIAAEKGFVVESYRDEAVGLMEKNAEGKIAITRVTLYPVVNFVGERLPDENEINAMHHQAHEECFIANSVKTDVRCEPKSGTTES